MKERCIIMIGPAIDAQGGISAVVGALRTGGLFKRCGIEYIVSHLDGTGLTKFITAVMGWFRFAVRIVSRRVTLVHVHMASRASFWRKLGFVLPAFVMRVPVVLHLHGAEFRIFYGRESSAWLQWLIRYVFERAHRVIVLSRGWREWVEDQFPNARPTVVYNPAVLDARAPFDAREPMAILFLGRLGERKGTFDLLEAVALLVSQFPGATLLLGGDGELEAARNCAVALGISTNVKILGWVRGGEKSALLERSSVYVLPSYNEGLPMSVLEAMAAGLPVVSTPVGGIPEAVSDGVEGFLVQPGDVQTLAERLGRLMGDADLRRRMGDAARQKVESAFAVERIVPQIEAIYSECASLGGPF